MILMQEILKQQQMQVNANLPPVQQHPFQGLRGNMIDAVKSNWLVNTYDKLSSDLKCAAQGGPFVESEYSELIYWQDIPSDELLRVRTTKNKLKRLSENPICTRRST